jgi:transposase
MSLHPHTPEPVPEQTVRVARAAVPHDNPYVRVRDAMATIYEDEQFRPLFLLVGGPPRLPGAWRW